MTPTLSHLPLSSVTDEHFVHVVNDLLTAGECEELIAAHTTDLIRINATYTSRLREVYDDGKLSELLWERLKPFYGTMQIVDEENETWLASHLNTRFRFCKYLPGDGFGEHIDGRRLAALDSQSFMAVNIYLNDVPKSAKGSTRVLDPSAPGEQKGDNHKVLGKVQPVLGSAAIFRDSLFHDGEPLKEGVKYLLRTDMMFERKEPFDFERKYGGLERKEQGRKALNLAKRLEDGGNGNDAVTWYRKAFKLYPELERGWEALEEATRLEDGGNSDEAMLWYRKAFKLCPELEREA